MANDGIEATAGKREVKVQRWFLTESNPTERVPRATNDVTIVGFTFADGTESQIDLKDVFGGSYPPVSVGRAAAAFGINTSAGNAANTAEEKTPAGLKDAVDARLETFGEGRWSAERAEGGPRSSLFFDALLEYRRQNGADISEAKMAALRTTFADAEQRKAALANGAFKKVYLTMQHERAIAQAEKSGGDAGALLG